MRCSSGPSVGSVKLSREMSMMSCPSTASSAASSSSMCVAVRWNVLPYASVRRKCGSVCVRERREGLESQPTRNRHSTDTQEEREPAVGSTQARDEQHGGRELNRPMCQACGACTGHSIGGTRALIGRRGGGGASHHNSGVAPSSAPYHAAGLHHTHTHTPHPFYSERAATSSTQRCAGPQPSPNPKLNGRAQVWRVSRVRVLPSHRRREG